MRILAASGIFHPEAGGPATYLYHLLPELQKRGHHVSALTFGDAEVRDYPYLLTRIPRQSYLRRQIDYYRAATRLWTGHDLAYIHSLGLPLPAKIRPRLAKIVGDQVWERAINKGWVSPTTDVDEFQTGRYPLTVTLNKMLYYSEARRFDGIIVPSEYLKHMVIGWGVDPEKVRVIYNALDTGDPIPSESRSEARTRLGLADTPLLLTAARLTPWKGVDHTIRAIARLDNVHLLVAGDGAIRLSLEALARQLDVADRVHFLGHVGRGKLALYFRAADYTVLYSGYEGLPHVLLESLHYGTPVIASHKGGNPEVVQHGVNGWLVPYIDVDTLATAIEKALAPDEQARCAANSAFGLERFSWESLVEQTEAVLREVAGV